MTSTTERVAVIGTGLIGTSIGLASRRVGYEVRGWDLDSDALTTAATMGACDPAPSIEECVEGADLVIIATPIPTVAELAIRALKSAPDAVVTDAASVKTVLADQVLAHAGAAADRWVPGHPMGGSERSGPEHASASVVDGIVWVVTPTESSSPEAVARVQHWVARVGARPVTMSPGHHDRLVAFVSHLPQVASTSLMNVAASEESGEPELLMLAAGGFRDLTRLAASSPSLWSDILLANRDALAEAIDRFMAELSQLKQHVLSAEGADIERTFADAKAARLRLSAKPRVRAGISVIQVMVPDQPGSLAKLTAALEAGDVNIEDLAIVHSPEGGKGHVHLSVAATDVDRAITILAGQNFDPTALN